MFSKIYLIIVRCGYLGFMREPALTLILIEHRTSGNRHDGECAVVVYPRTRLVSLLQSANLGRGVFVCPSVSILAGLWRPEVHSPWHCHCRVGISGGKFISGFGSDKCAYQIRRRFHKVNVIFAAG